MVVVVVVWWGIYDEKNRIAIVFGRCQFYFLILSVKGPLHHQLRHVTWCFFWVTGSRGSRCVFLAKKFWVTGSRWSRGSRCVFLRKKLFLGHRVTWVTWSFLWENFVSGSQGHVDTQNWVTYVTRKPIVHRDTGSRWSRGSRGVFFGKILFLGHRVTWITLWVIGKFCFWYTWSRWSRWSQCFF